MSLINDALKRASEAQRAQREPRMPVAIMHPAGEVDAPAAGGPSDPSPRGPRLGSPALLRIVLGVGLLAVAVILLLVWWHNRPPSEPQETIAQPQKATPSKEAATNPAALSPIAPLPPRLAPTNAVTNVVAVQPTNTVTPPPVVPAPPPMTNAVALRPPIPTPTLPPVETNRPPTLPAVTLAPPEPVPPKPPVAVKPPAEPAFPQLKLQGIIYRAKNPSALVNGHNVTLGDMIENTRVVSIGRDSVFFEFRGRTNEVFLLR